MQEHGASQVVLSSVEPHTIYMFTVTEVGLYCHYGGSMYAITFHQNGILSNPTA